MRGYFVYYLKILWLFCACQKLTAGIISTDAAYKKVMRMRSLPFEDCGSKYQVLYLKIESCTTVPCSMARNSTVTVTVLFDDNGSGVTFLKHEVRWVFNYVKSPAAITPDPCDGNQNHCIFNVNDGLTYLAELFVNATLPVSRGAMLWESKDEYNVNLICFEVPVVITL